MAVLESNTKPLISITKPLISISIIGHVDSGKSTLCGQLATRFGPLNKREQDKLTKIASENSKTSFALAYFSDRTEQERKRGVTIQTTLVEMETSKFRVNFLDCPGHADYIKNATSGCKQSDLSVVVVPADFQASCSVDGTLKTHLTLAAVLGSKQFIVCINKLDEIAAKNKTDLETTFDAASAAVGKLLKKLGVKLESVIFLPISALNGIGVFKGGDVFPFYKGFKPANPEPGYELIMTLEEAINSQKAPSRPTDKPLRLPISSVCRVPGQGIILCGRVDYGSIKKGDQIKILPIDLTAEVKNVQAHKQDVEAGISGMNIGFSIITKDKIKYEAVKAGDMVGPAIDPEFMLYPFYTISAVSLKGKAKSGQDEKGIKAGYTPVLSCGTSNIATKFVKLISAQGKDTLVEDPTIISKDQRFSALIYPSKQALFESYKKFPFLGKFVCRDSGVLVVVGQISECISEEKAKSTYNYTIADATGIKPVGAPVDKKGKK
ncbi:LOW QUALITY PROTEIN: uncharacterized protein LOC143921933 [Arctopsyche grandis]|uniref:LOW QUALITY PROTEIN: uncharacterized protein LOC143921933 n=1 Tax=Arctopsyche grandis TaxID=121162 RepID=UPI00406D90B2